jgi:hypothetical protein
MKIKSEGDLPFVIPPSERGLKLVVKGCTKDLEGFRE